MWVIFGFFVVCGVGFFVGSACYDGLRRSMRRVVVEVGRPGVTSVDDGNIDEVEELVCPGLAFCFVEADEEYREVYVNG